MRNLILATIVAALAVPTLAQDQSTSALINEALDKNVKIQLDGVLPDVLKKIANDTGVKIRPTPSVYELLPWGEETRIKATVEGKTLRQALTAITRKLGLTWELGQFEVNLKPMPALARLGRRATVAELQALDLLSETPISYPATGPHNAQALLDAIDQKLAAIKEPALAVELRAGDPANPQAGVINLEQTINLPRNATIADALDALAQDTDATWYPWGKNIVVLPKQAQFRMALDKPITAHFDGTDIAQVLSFLSEQAGVAFAIEPGAIQRVPSEYRSIRLQLENATIRQVLDDIRGVTGLDYVVKPEGVYIWNQNPNGAGPRAAGGDPVVAMLELDGGLQLLLRESQVPPDLREYLNHKSDEQIARLRKRMKDEGFVPTTQPATQPAPKDKDQ